MTGIGGVVSGEESDGSTNNDQETLTDGLIAYYPADDPEDTTTATDTAGDHDAQLFNGVSYHGSGKVGTNSLVFDGTDDYAEAPGVGPRIDEANAFTIAYWINYRTLEKYRVPYGFEPADFWTEPYRNGSNGISIAFTDDAGSTHELNSGTVLDSPDVWYHITYTWDGTVLAAYLDGNQVGTLDTGGVNCVTGNPHQIGRWGEGGYYLDGIMDDIRIYDRALTSGEVERLAALTESNDPSDDSGGATDEGDSDKHKDEDDERDDRSKGNQGDGNGKGNGNSGGNGEDHGNGKGHGKGKGKGHQKGRGKGHHKGRGRGPGRE